MKLLSNSGSDRALEWLRASLSAQGRLDIASSELSLFVFGAAESNLADSATARLLLPAKGSKLSLLGGPADRAAGPSRRPFSADERLYHVIEAKSSTALTDLRDRARAKIKCGERHFDAVATDDSPAQFRRGTSLPEVLAAVES